MIKLLDDGLINKIAAGEVVDRPVSIVKELIENSLDAGANQITIEIADGGTSLIRISDDGSGILSEETPMAFMRHATSKIENDEDLTRVLTLGFRGEALSSVSAVSRVEMITKHFSESIGTRLIIEGGRLVSKRNIGAPKGTTIVARDIFFNAPARRKFLKKTSAEAGSISDVAAKYALGRPQTAFKYINNRQVILTTTGSGNLQSAIMQVYGSEAAKKLLEIKSEISGLRVWGFLGEPQSARGNRAYQSVFINGRLIKSELISRAIEEGYGTKLMIGKFPLFVINLEIEPDKIDVNVHPSKLQIRFADERAVFDAVFDATVNSFLSREKPIRTIGTIDGTIDFDADGWKKPLLDIIPKETWGVPDAQEEIKEIKEVKEVKEIKEEEIFEQIKIIPVETFYDECEIKCQLFNTYWVIERQKSTFLIDQHAAHERIIYDELMEKFKNKIINSQLLLEPQILQLSEREIEILNENLETFDKFGFIIERIGEIRAVKGVPYIFNKPQNANFIMEIIDRLGEISKIPESVYEARLEIVAKISCKAAVKANDKLSYQEGLAIIKRLLKTKDPFNCPHGRPTIIEMTQYELEKKFRRII
jgi:DNA mismatch repair protein MutL